MRSPWFDLLSILKSKLAIGLLLLVLLTSAASATSITVSSVSPSQNPSLYHAYYNENGTYHIVNFIFDAYGNPIKGVNINLSIFSRSWNRSTNDAGFANLSIPGLVQNRTYQVTENYSYSGNNYSYKFLLEGTVPEWGIGTYKIYTVYNYRDPYLMNILLVYTGSNGSTSGPVDVYIAQNSVIQSNSTPVLVGTATNFCDALIVPPVTLLSPDMLYSITVVPTNVTAARFQPDQVNITGYTLETANPSEQLANQAADIVDGSYLFIASIVSVMIAYSFYGRLTTTNKIEGIVSKPITRRQLFFSRYFATLILLLAMSTLTMGSMDVYAFAVTGFWISTIPMLEMILGIFLSCASLAGLAMVVSSFSKSDLLGIGIPIALAIVLSLLWIPIMQVVTAALGFGSGINSTYAALHRAEFMNVWVLSYYLNPLGSLTLASSLTTGYLPSVMYSVSFSSFEPTVSGFFLDGLIWVVLTFLLGLFRSRVTE